MQIISNIFALNYFTLQASSVSEESEERHLGEVKHECLLYEAASFEDKSGYLQNAEGG